MVALEDRREMDGPERGRAMRSKMLVPLLASAAVLALTTTASGTVQGLITGKPIAHHSITSRHSVNGTLQAFDRSAGSIASLQGRSAAAPGEIAYPGNGKIYLIEANGTDQRVLISGGFRVDEWGGIAWSRDGGQIAFTVGNHRAGELYGDTLQLYVAAGNGTKVRPLRGTPTGSFDPTWSPDGSQIAFAIRGQDETSIAVIGVDGKGIRKLASSTNPRDFYWVPDWSPDGSWILFESKTDRELRTRLMAVRPNGTGLHQLATFDTDNHCICADWSPDGERIAYQAPGTPPRYDYPEIWVMSADGADEFSSRETGRATRIPTGHRTASALRSTANGWGTPRST